MLSSGQWCVSQTTDYKYLKTTFPENRVFLIVYLLYFLILIICYIIILL